MTVTPEWMTSAACADPTLGSPRSRARVFYPDESNSANPPASPRGVWAAAKTVCRRCPVSAACLAHALENREGDGVWGGLDPTERRVELLRVRRDQGVPA